MKIGLFDSGLGGLLVYKKVAQKLPHYDYIYYGDTKNVPYGDRSESEIYKYTKTAVEYLFAQDCLLVVLACNTASAETLRKLQDKYLKEQYPDRRIIGVIVPMVEEIVAHTCQQVLLLGTQRTVSSGKYHIELGKRDGLLTRIEAVATPALVPLLEAGELIIATEIAAGIINDRLGRGDAVDGVLLGCTHYNLLLPSLRERYPGIVFFGQTEIIPRKLGEYLERHPEIEKRLTRSHSRTIYLTKHREDYDDMVKAPVTVKIN